MQPEILFEDVDLIILNKPAGMPVEFNPFGDASLQDFVADHCGNTIRIRTGPGVVHRLDKVTSGIVVMAKKPSILKQLNADFAQGLPLKTYHALVSGKPEPQSATLTHELEKDSLARKARAAKRKTKTSKTAVLSYETETVTSTQTLLCVHLKTGRYHQIRAQLAAVGHPVIGDTHYGGPAAARVMLHCSRLVFTHPKTGQETDTRCEAGF
ncbi:MAG: RluA family pseudouridine synthase [Balneolales bacterium]|nr:RluA family pseudouridine synthase [Balneolales bacterium]